MSNLDLSIIGIIQKAITLAPTASSEELLELSRAARNLDQSENADVEIAINSRIEEISPEATHWDLRALGKTVANLLEREEVSFAGGDIGKGYLPAQHHQQGKYLVTSGADESYGSGSSKTWVRPTTKNIDDFTVGSLYPNTTFQYNEVTGKYITEDTVFPIIISELSDLPAEGSTIGELAYDTTRGQMRFWNGEKWQFVNIRYAMGGWYENEDFSISVSSTSFNADEAILDESLERYTGIFGKKDTASVSSVSFNSDEAILDESLERYTGIFGKKDTASVSSTSFNADEAILDESLERYTGLFGKKDAPSVSSTSFNADEAILDESLERYTGLFGKKDAPSVSSVSFNADSAQYDNQPPIISNISDSYVMTSRQNTVITASGADPEGKSITWSFEEVVSGSNYVVVGAQTENDNGTRSGAVYVYDASDLSSPATKLNVSSNAADDRLGFSVDVSDDKIVVGAPFDDDNGNNAGAVYVFDTNDLSATPIQLTAHDFVPNDEWGDQFGKSVAVTSNKIVVGAMRNTENGYNAGAAYVFDISDLSTQPTKLTAYDGAAMDQFGQFVAASDDKIVIASAYDDDNGNASGSVYVYDANDLSAQPTKLTAFDGAAMDFFGYSVAATADKIVVGAQLDDDNGNDSGSVYVYGANDLSAQPTKLTAFDGAENDRFGYSVAANADKIVVGAQRDDDNGNDSGSVYVYDANDLSAQPTKLTAFDGTGGDYFGSSVAISGDKIVVGSDQGQFNVYVYDLNDLSAQPEVLTQSTGFGNAVAAISSTSALNGTTVTQSNNIFTITPGIGDANFTLRFIASDNFGETSHKDVSFTHDYINAAPEIQGIESSYTLTQEQDTVITATAIDVEGDDVTWSYEELLVDNRPTLPQSVYGIGQISMGAAYVGLDFNAGSETLVQQIVNQISSKSNVTKITFLSGDSVMHEITRNGQYLIGLSSGSLLQIYDSAYQSTPNWSGFPTTYAISEYGINQGQDSSTHYTDAVVSFDTVKVYGTGATSVVTYTDNLTGDVVRIGDEPQSQLNGVTVSQSDNIFTITPARQDANFNLKLIATDSVGNVATTTTNIILDYVNQAPVISGVDSTYTLTQGQDAVITASATDIEGDDITWSYEEIPTETSLVVMTDGRTLRVYDNTLLETSPIDQTVARVGLLQHGSFGSSYPTEVVVSNNRIFVGDSGYNNKNGSILVYDINSLETSPSRIDLSSGGSYAGSTIAGNDNIIVTSYNNNNVRIYDTQSLSLIKTLQSPSGSYPVNYGDSIVVGEEFFFVGASRTLVDGTAVGSVSVYRTSNNSLKKILYPPSDANASPYEVRFGESFMSINDKHVFIGTAQTVEDHGGRGSLYAYALGEDELNLDPIKLTNSEIYGFGYISAADENYLAVGGMGSNKVAVYNANDLSQSASIITLESSVNRSLHVDEGILYVNLGTNGVYVYNLSNLEETPKFILGSMAGESKSISSLIPPSSLNGTTITQSDNVFTVTPGTADADFRLRITATDSEGNVTSTTSDFTLDYVNQSPAVSGIESDYTLTQGQDTVITASATDPEGDAITWSYSVVGDVPEKNYVGIVAAGESNKIHLYDSTDLNISPIIVTAPDGVYFSRGLSSYKNDILSSAGSLFAFDGHNTFSSEELVSYDAETTDYLGYSMAVHGDNIFLSAPGEVSYTGAVYVYNAEDLSAQPLKLTAPDGAESDWFGRVIEIVGDRLYVSAPYDDDVSSNSGSVYVYDINDLSANPIKLNSTGSDVSNYNFGTSISGFSQGKIAIGAQWADNPSNPNGGNTNGTGAVYVFDENNLTGTPIALIPSDITTNDMFGVSVSASDDKLFIGCPRDDEGANQNLDFANVYNSGSVYVYDANNLSATPTKITAPNTIYNGWFGEKVLVVGDKLYVGSRYENVDRVQARSDRYQNSDFYDDPTGYGAVYVYDVNNLSAPPIKLTSDSDEKTSFGWNIVSLYIPESDTLNDVTVSQSDNVFTVTPAQQDANFTLKFNATDTAGNVTSVTSDFNYDYNAPPVIMGIEPAYTLTQGVNQVIVPMITDAEGETVTMTYEEVLSEGVPSGLNGTTITQSGNDFTIIPGNADANFTLRFTATDTAGNTDTRDADFSLNYNVNPVLSGIGSSYTLTQDQDTVITAAISDADGDPITLTYAVTSGDMVDTTISQSSNVFTVTPGVQDASFQITFTATDPYGGTSEIVSDFNYDYNAPPVISGIEPVYTLTQGVDEVIVGMSSDADGDAVTWSFAEVLSEGVPSGLNGTTITQNGGEFTVTPGTADANFTIRFTLTDTAGNTDTRDADFSLTYVNQAPAVSGIDAAYTLTQGQDTVITAAATDPEGDAITWSYEEVKSGASYMIVGANADDDNGNNSGSVYVYDANDLSASPTKLTAFDGAADDYFGYRVAVTADKIVVGAPLDDAYTGSVYVYDMNDLSAQPTKLTPFDAAADDRFGFSVAATADKIVVGAFLDDDNGDASGSVYVYDANDLSAQPTKLTAFDGAEYDYFGYSVAATADKIVVSAIWDDDNGSSSGSVYVYDANDLSASPTKLTAFDGAQDDWLGYSVAATSDKIVVGAIFDGDNGAYSGSVYVYDANDLSAQPTKLTAFDGAADDRFGNSVIATDDKIFVYAPHDDDRESNSGSIYVYDANDLSAEPTKLTAFDGAENDYFGGSVATTADKIFVSARGDDDNGENSGSIYVYDANDLSAQPTKLTAFDAAEGDYFGVSIAISPPPSSLNGVTVAQSDNVFTVTPAQQDATFTLAFKATDTAGNVTSVSSDFTLDYVNQAPTVAGIDAAYTLTQGQDTVITASATDPEGDAITWSYEEVMSSGANYVVVGAYLDDDNGTDSGSVYVYDANDLSAQPTKLTAFDGAEVDYFGYSVAATADKIVVGANGDDDNGFASGSIYAYDANNLSAQPTKLTAFDAAAEDRFGQSVAATADKIIVGAYLDDDKGSGSGSVYVYDANDLSAQPTKLTAFDGAADDRFGISVIATDDKIVVGAYLDDDNGENSGSVYVYDANDLSAQPTKLTAFDGAADDKFGQSIAADADKVVVGAWSDDDNGLSSGSVYVYDINDLSATPTKLTAFDGAQYDQFGVSVAVTNDKIFVGANSSDDDGSNSGSVYVYDANDLSAQPTKMTAPDAESGMEWGSSISCSGDNVIIGTWRDNNFVGSVYVYDANNLSAQPTKLTPFDGAAGDRFSYSIAQFTVLSSALNGVTVTQSDNVFTVTPGSEETSFQLTFKATDSEGNVTSTTSDFTVEAIPEPQMGDLFIGSDGYSTGDFNRESEVDAWTKTSNTSWLVHRSGEGGHMEMGWGTDNQVGAYIELDVVPNTEYTISFSGTATSGAPVGHANYRDAYVNVRVVDSEPVGTNAAALILQTTPSTTGGTYPNGSTASNGWQPQTSKSGYQTLSGTITPHGSKLTIQILNVDKVVQYFDDFSVTGLVPV